MTIQAQLPDNTVLEFPDDTDRSIVDKAVKGYLIPKTPEGVPIPDAKPGTSITKKDTVSSSDNITSRISNDFGDEPLLSKETEKASDTVLGPLSPLAKGAVVGANALMRGGNAVLGGVAQASTEMGKDIETATGSEALGFIPKAIGETLGGVQQGAFIGSGLGDAVLEKPVEKPVSKSFEEVVADTRGKNQPIFDSVFKENQDKWHQEDLFQSQKESLANVALGARDPFKRTPEQTEAAQRALEPTRTPEAIDAEIKALAQDTAAVGAKDKLAELQAEKAKFTDKSVIFNKDRKLSDEQFQTNIAEPVQNAIDNGVPKAVIQKELEDNLAVYIRDPEYRQTVVDKAMEPHRDTASIQDRLEAINADKEPISADTLNTGTPVPPSTIPALNGSNIASTGKNLITAEEVAKVIKPSFTAANVNSLNYFDRLSRVFSKKNGKVYGDLDNNLGDTLLNKAKLAREQNRNVITSLIGDTDGTQRYVWGLKDGVQVKNTDVLPLTTIYTDAKRGGIPLEDLTEFSKAANALDDYSNIQKQITSTNKNIADLTTELHTATKPTAKQSIRNQIKTAKADLVDLSKKKSYMSETDAQAIYNKFNENPAGQKFLADRRAWFQHLLETSKESGLLSEADVAKISEQHQNYLPSFREVETYGEDLGGSTNAKGATKGYTNREISDKEFNSDPIENEMTKGMSVVRRAQDNIERQHMVDWLVNHLDDKAFSTVFRESKEEVMKAIDDAKNGQAGPVTQAQKISANPTPTIVERPGNMSVWYNGKRIDLTIRNVDGESNFRDSILNPNSFVKSHAPESAQAAMRGWVNTAQVSRNILTTWNPLFSIGAMMKSTLDYPFITSSKISGINRFNPLSSVKAAYELATDKDLNSYIKANISPGVLNRDLRKGASKDLIDNARSSLEDKSFLGKAKDKILAPGKMVIHNLEDFAELSENMNRYRYYKEAKADALKRGLSTEDAERAGITAGKNLEVNYFQKGYGTAFNKWTSITPFLRTQINSMSKNLLAARYRPKQMAGTMATMAGAFYAIDAYNKQYTDKNGEPLINHLDPDVRKNNVVIYLPGAKEVNDYVKIPAGFSPFTREATIASVGVEKAATAVAKKIVDNAEPATKEYIKNNPKLAVYMKDNNLTINDLTTMGFDALVGQFNISSALPVGLSQATNLVTNKDAFGKDIVPSYLDGLPASQQISPGRTSQVMSALSDYATKTGRPELVNPIIADYLITGFFGSTGKMALDGADLVYSHATGKEIPQKEGQTSIPGASRFTGRGSNIQSEGISTQYNNLYKEFKGIQDSVDAFKKNVDVNPENANSYLQSQKDHAKELELYNNYFKPTQDYIKNAYAEINRLQAGNRRYSDETTSTKELFGDPVLREKIDELRNKIIEAQRSVLEKVEDDKEELGDKWTDRLSVLPQTKAIEGFFRSLKGNMISDVHGMDNPPAIIQQAPEQDSSAGFFKNLFSNANQGLKNMYKDDVIDNTIKMEGGFVNTQHDKGGATNMGITLNTLREFNPKATATDVQKLTPEQAKQIYSTRYWDAGKVGQMPTDVQDLVFDMNVNHGLMGSGKIVQKALNKLGANIPVNGHVDDTTLKAMKNYDSITLRRAILNQRKALYNNIIANDPTQAKFKDGWMKRVDAMTEPLTTES